jgi:nicotinate-nucleotide adenylyltransferase
VKVGLFGGTFDPPHAGHLIVAQDAATALGLDRILFIPAAQPPHKQHTVVSPADLRARMISLATAADERFAVDTLELQRSGPSYTVDTVQQLTESWPAVEWTLLIGADQHAEFHTWREPERIRRLARIGVLEREGTAAVTTAAARGAAAAEAAAVHVAVTRIDISSTMIRLRVAAGQPIRYLVPEPVEEFIFQQQLYVGNGSLVTG